MFLEDTGVYLEQPISLEYDILLKRKNSKDTTKEKYQREREVKKRYSKPIRFIRRRINFRDKDKIEAFQKKIRERT